MGTLLQFFKDLGYRLGSSPYLARALVRASWITWRDNIVILELWAGTGNVTREILKHLSSDSHLTAFEIEDKRFVYLKQYEQANVWLIRANVRRIEDYCERETADVIISTLPLGGFDDELLEASLEQIQNVLKPGWTYIQYQYAFQNLGDVKRYFTLQSLKFEMRNFWPAVIYVTKKP